MKRNHSLLEYTRDNDTQVSEIGPSGPSCKYLYGCGSDSYMIHLYCFVVQADFYSNFIEPATIAELDAHPTGDQVAGAIHTGPGNILSRRLIMKHFLWSFSHFHHFTKGCKLLSVSGDRMCTVLVNHLED